MNLRLTPALWGGVFLILLYTGFYLGDPNAPGNNASANWMGWSDQGFYYRSAAFLAGGYLEPRFHWYPLGYSLVAAPFIFLRSNIFFFVDLFGLLGTYAAFLAFARRVGVATITGIILFLLSVCADPVLFEQWTIPWNTSLSAGLIWALLAVCAADLQGLRRPFVMGLLAAALPLVRPTDAMLSALCLSCVGIDAALSRRFVWRDVGAATAGALALLVPYGALHLGIYGPHISEYVIDSRRYGFTLHNPIWRAYVLLIEPRQWFFAGAGILARIPWLLLGFAGAVYALRRRSPETLLAVCLIAYCVLFLAYVDLLPTGVWRYFNIHYFKWTLPGFALLAWRILHDLAARRRAAWAVLAVVFLLSCIHVTPRPAKPLEAAIAVDIPGPPATEGNSTMSADLWATDATGPLPNIVTMRAFPFLSSTGVRVIGIRRDMDGTVGWLPGHGLPMPADPPPQVRWAEQISLGYPCWLPPHPCKKQTVGR